MLDRLREVMKDSVIPKQVIIEAHSEMDSCTQARAHGQLSMMPVHWWTLPWNEIVRPSMIFLEVERGARGKGFGNQHVGQCVQRFLCAFLGEASPSAPCEGRGNVETEALRA